MHNIICLVYAYLISNLAPNSSPPKLKHLGGEHLRTRKILRHPKYGGKTCDGALAELKAPFLGENLGRKRPGNVGIINFKMF